MAYELRYVHSKGNYFVIELLHDGKKYHSIYECYLPGPQYLTDVKKYYNLISFGSPSTTSNVQLRHHKINNDIEFKYIGTYDKNEVIHFNEKQDGLENKNTSSCELHKENKKYDDELNHLKAIIEDKDKEILKKEEEILKKEEEIIKKENEINQTIVRALSVIEFNAMYDSTNISKVLTVVQKIDDSLIERIAKTKNYRSLAILVACYRELEKIFPKLNESLMIKIIMELNNIPSQFINGKYTSKMYALADKLYEQLSDESKKIVNELMKSLICETVKDSELDSQTIFTLNHFKGFLL